MFYFRSPLGVIRIESENEAITGISFVEREPDILSQTDYPLIEKDCSTQLSRYFEGSLTKFELTLVPQGTPFQLKVWKMLIQIPYGKTLSYLSIARSLGDEHLARAVGHAIGANPIPIIIPCHRVVGKTGKLIGYLGGTNRKAWLIKHEQEVLGANGLQRLLF